MAAGFSGPHLELIAASEGATRANPPLWPPSSSVAANPFMGQSHQILSQTAALMGRVAGMQMTMPPSWYLARIKDGTIIDADLTAALAIAPKGAPTNLRALKVAVATRAAAPRALPTVAHLAAEPPGIDWPALIEDGIGTWDDRHFDTGQALWQATLERGAFENWQIFASHDLTPKIAGLSGFARTVANASSRSKIALPLACDAVGPRPEAAKPYFTNWCTALAAGRRWLASICGRPNWSAGPIAA